MAYRLIGRGAGSAFLIAATYVNDAVAVACSSPQTTELNAKARSQTLMKWVTIGLAESAAFIWIAANVEEEGGDRVAIIVGGLLSGGLKAAYYWHARASGLKSSKPGTEQW